jgi:GrpB-like predicted nucleotidyltransferase (UPF0157 family)
VADESFLERSSIYQPARVRLNSYDCDWPRRYTDEASLLRDILGSEILGLEHIGSTAIPEMPAKPTIDLLLAVSSYDRFLPLVEQLDDIGYLYTPSSEADKIGRRVFRKGPKDMAKPRTHHLHVTKAGSYYWQRIIAFRNYLRDHPAEAAAYADLKRDLVSEFAHDSRQYTAGKHNFVTAIEHKAADMTRDRSVHPMVARFT